MDDAPSLPQAPSPPASTVIEQPTSRQARWWRRFGWTMAGIWLAFLAEPFQVAAENPNRLAGVSAMAALLAFAALYLRPWMPSRRREDHYGLARGLPTREAARDLAVLSALAALSLPGAGLDGLETVVFLCTYALLTLPLRPTLPAVAGVLVATAVVGWAVPGASTLQGVAEGGFFACVAVFGFSRMMLRTRQLADAQTDLARLAVTEERSRFSRDLHDLLGHSLTVVTLKAELAGRLLEAGSEAGRERAATEVADIERLARDALQDVRAALAGFREVSLGAELAGARQALAAAGIIAELPGAVDDVPADRRELFGWVVREGVTNIVRHSSASRCWVELTPTSVTVCDDGTGPAPISAARLGSGLRGLADRAEAAGATLVVGRSEAGGFSVRVSMAAVPAGRNGELLPRDLAPVAARLLPTGTGEAAG